MTWEKVNIVAEEVAVIVPIPDAVLDDADYDIWGEVQPRIEEAFAKVIDMAVFHGTNKPDTWPEGLVSGAIKAGKVRPMTGDLYQDINGEDGVIALVEEKGRFSSARSCAARWMRTDSRFSGWRTATARRVKRCMN